MRVRVLLFCSLILTLAAYPRPAFAAHAAGVTDNRAELDFPNMITFRAAIKSETEIDSVVLEYGTHQLTCGDVIALAFPQFAPGKSVDVDWSWDMRQSGSLPPGTSIWWRWRYTDASGVETVSEENTILWLDSQHHWDMITGNSVRLHWYADNKAFAQDLLNAATSGLARLKTDTGLAPDQPIDLYIYGNTADMREAVLFEPGWTGGLAFPEHNIVIIGISSSDLDWGRKAEVHELTHVLVGHLTFSCLGAVPTWLDEGLAVYSEGALDSASQSQLDDAIQTDTLLSVRSLSGGFSEVPSKAYLSYSESYSIVKFLIETYGRAKMTALLTALRDGATIDEALTNVYGFNVEGLEDAWREAIGAAPRSVAAQATAQPTPTFVPTIVPLSGAPLALTPTPFVVPTTSTGSGADNPQRTGPPLSLTLLLLGICCLLSIVVGVFALGLFVYLPNQKRVKNG
jgi:hypothetical protein